MNSKTERTALPHPLVTPTRVLCIRHGETDWNAAGRWQGHAPVPLNAVGRAQSQALASYLARNGWPLAALYSSDLPRALQTAQAIAEALGLPVRPDARLREIDLGEWQGLTREEVLAWDAERYAAYLADRDHVPTPNGETHLALRTRVLAAFDDITSRHAGQTVALVTHGGTLGVLLVSLFGPLERPSLTNTSITVIEQTTPEAPWVLVRVAWAPHLDEQPLGETW
ncbi:MAG: histidine phosphatase family protein [Aggregatilineaceae bacterium]